MDNSGEVWAAWVQAVGSIVAIGVAIWISRHESRETRRREAERRGALARSFAYRHMSKVIALRREAEEVRNFASAHAAGFEMTHDLRMVEQKLKVSDFLLGPEEPGWALPPASAKAVYQLSNFTSDYNGFVMRHVPRLRSMDGAERASYTNRLNELHVALLRIADAAKKGLGEIHD